MITGLASAPPFKLLAALLLAVIGLHATPAKPISLRIDQGPAFSASSVDVSLPPRKEVRAEVRQLAVPHPRVELEEDWSAAVGRDTAARFWPVPRSTGPPPRPPRGPQSATRAPPIA